MKVLALDIATKTGWAFHSGSCEMPYVSGTWNNTPKPGTKTREAEPAHYRLKHIYENLCSFRAEHGLPDLLVIEEAQGFIRGKAAVESSHQYRAIVLYWCAVAGVRVVTINPNDLLYFALGKRTCKRDEKKREMITLARTRYGYTGSSDDEAEAIILLHWALRHYAA